jgi:hypothetical protein
MALRKLRMLNNARVVGDLAVPPNNRPEPSRAIGRDSTSGSATNGEFAAVGPKEVPSDVESVDYH